MSPRGASRSIPRASSRRPAARSSPAQVIDAGSPVVTLGDAGSGHVLRALVADRDAVRLREGMVAEVSLEALPGAVLAGRVIEIGGRSDRQSGAFTVEIALPPDPRLRSGLIGSARIAAPPAQGSTLIVIPPTALFAVRADEGFVYVVGPDRKVRARKVALGPLGTAGGEVLSGLKTGEIVVTSALDRLREGQAVDPVRAAP
jgi:RND family efflux transporter MFP subunit